jgi:hypothetical protein
MTTPNHLNPLDPDLVAEQNGREVEVHTAREALQAIDELKKCKKGYAWLIERFTDKAADYHRAAIEGKTPEEREIARLIYLKFKEEIIPMIDIDEENHRRTVQEAQMETASSRDRTGLPSF